MIGHIQSISDDIKASSTCVFDYSGDFFFFDVAANASASPLACVGVLQACSGTWKSGWDR